MSENHCACPRFASARECFRIRYPQPYGLGEDCDSDGSEDGCECVCHEEQRRLDAERRDEDIDAEAAEHDGGFW